MGCLLLGGSSMGGRGCGLLLYLGSPTCPSSSAGGLPFPSPLEGLCLTSGRIFHWHLHRSTFQVGLPGSSDGEESACNLGDQGLIPGSGRSPGEENGMNNKKIMQQIIIDRSLKKWCDYPLIMMDSCYSHNDLWTEKVAMNFVLHFFILVTEI